MTIHLSLSKQNKRKKKMKNNNKKKNLLHNYSGMGRL